MHARSLALAALLFASCTVTMFRDVPADTLYFGSKDQQQRVVVTPEEFQKFVNEVVASRFPCSTWWPANGQWQQQNEPSFVLQLLYEGECTKENELAVRQIIEEYRRRYDQQSVLRVRSHVGLAR
jgi:hypothetical protein